MSDNRDIENLLKKFGDDNKKNADLVYMFILKKDLLINDFLHLLVNKVYEEKKVLKTIFMFREHINDVGPYKYNVVQHAIASGYSEGFINSLIMNGRKNQMNPKLDINHVDDRGNTIMHNAIYSENYSGNIVDLFKLMLTLGFDYTIKNNQNKTFVDAMKDVADISGKYTVDEVDDVVELYNKV